MMEGNNSSCQAAYLRVYSLLFYKNPMLESKATTKQVSPKKFHKSISGGSLGSAGLGN